MERPSAYGANVTTETADQTRAVVFEEPKKLSLRWIPLPALGSSDVEVQVEWSGISTGTEKLFYRGEMPPFPGMGYPLVPGYETVGRVTGCGQQVQHLLGQRVFVSGANCFGDVHGLFGGAASKLVVDASKVLPVDGIHGEEATLLALAATAHHALTDHEGNYCFPGLIIGHGVLGRLMARLVCALSNETPTVWETDGDRRDEQHDYLVVHPDEDRRASYHRIVDVSGDSAILDKLIAKLKPTGEVILAGFYPDALSFTFPPAFMKEASIRVRAQWQPADLTAVKELVANKELDLSQLITHQLPASEATTAYDTAFSDSACLKMILDWRCDA